MKIKGIPFWEQHIEKFILGGFGVVLLGVGAMQVIMRPTDVTLENRPAGPDEVEKALKARADAVAAKLAASATSAPLVEGEVPLAMKTFPNALDGGVSPRTTLPITAPSLAAAILPSEASVAAARYYEPRMLAPRMVTVRQESDTLDETVLNQHPDLATVFHFEPGQPHDITWFVPVAEVSVAMMVDELHRAMENDKPPLLAIPTLWYNDALWVVDVVFERQELQEDGSWGAPAVVAVLPDQFSFRAEIEKAGIDLRDEMFRLLAQKDKVLSILQPDFLPTKGNTFSAGLILNADEPTEKVTSGQTDPEARKLNSLKQSHSRKLTERDRLAEQVKELGGPCEPTKPDERDRNKKEGAEGGGDGGSGSPKAPGGGGLGGGMSGGKNKGQPREKEDLDKCIRLTRRLKNLENEIEKLEDDIKRLAPAETLDGGKDVLDLAKDKKILVWAHDIWVKPGETYRYTCRIDSYNPFFARRRQLVPEQQRLSDPFALASAVSEPSKPVTVEPPVAIFVTEAQPNGGTLGLGRATVELYRFFDGARRAEKISNVQPGDRIGRVSEKRRDGSPSIDFTTDWFVVDIVEDGASEGKGSVRVLLRRIDEDRIVVRDPMSDEASSDRARFDDEVEAAKNAPAKPANQEGGEEGAPELPQIPGSGSGPGGK
ncbi:MAG: hypothetical protein JNL80_17150 [Phycisphaerae bacterium]|jgi:hypothetical protein|nr:hypothetical protein [Phycisphaerae bacterium]